MLLQVHGGAWMIGSKEQQGIPLMMHMAARGWVCVAINYPLSPRARWPEHLIAVKRAMAWIRETRRPSTAATRPSSRSPAARPAATWPRWLALTCAATRRCSRASRTSTRPVQACVPHYGVYDFTDESGSKPRARRCD